MTATKIYKQLPASNLNLLVLIKKNKNNALIIINYHARCFVNIINFNRFLNTQFYTDKITRGMDWYQKGKSYFEQLSKLEDERSVGLLSLIEASARWRQRAITKETNATLKL